MHNMFIIAALLLLTCRFALNCRYGNLFHYFVGLYSVFKSHYLVDNALATDTQRDGGLAQRRHSCTTFQIRTSRRRCAKPLVVGCAFCIRFVSCWFSYKKNATFRRNLKLIWRQYLVVDEVFLQCARILSFYPA